jgi:hypothetical protein
MTAQTDEMNVALSEHVFLISSYLASQPRSPHQVLATLTLLEANSHYDDPLLPLDNAV